MHNSWIVLVPPFLVLLVAIINRNVILSLLIGIISAGLIATNFSVVKTGYLVIQQIVDQSGLKGFFYKNESLDHIYTFGFLTFLGIIISLITQTGGISAYSKILQKKFKTKKNIEITSLVLSMAFFIDDYLNSLTVGCIMRPLTDKFDIPRVKLAYLINSMSAPLCVLIPASSWVALILSQLETSGVSQNINNHTQINADPFYVYLNSISYMFYPILVVLSAFFIVKKQITFGKMETFERVAENTSNLFGGKPPIELKIKECSTVGSLTDFILPIASFLVSTIALLLYSGNWSLFGNKSLFSAFLDANPFFALFYASLISLIISFTYLVINKRINFKEFKDIVIGGADLMKNSILVLLLAWTFGTILQENLYAGQYLANILLKALPAFTLPFTIFITSIIISASTGSAWGTIAVMIPLAVPSVIAFTNLQTPIVPAQTHLLFPVLASVISGAIAGGNISPISDATVLASTSSGSYHMDHVLTQIGYIMPAIIGAAIGLLAVGFFSNYNQLIVLPVSLILSAIITFGIILARYKISNPKIENK